MTILKGCWCRGVILNCEVVKIQRSMRSSRGGRVSVGIKMVKYWLDVV